MGFDILTRILIPLATFVLGAFFTFMLQRHWKHRDLVANSAKALAELTADWYNQLDDLRKALDQPAEPGKAAELVDSYVRNRLILPKILYHVAVLREQSAHRQLVLEAETFLLTVTSYGELGSTRALRCKDLFEGQPTDSEARAAFLGTLRLLDECQQSVAREAARVGP